MRRRRDSWEKINRDMTITFVLFEAACFALIVAIIVGAFR